MNNLVRINPDVIKPVADNNIKRQYSVQKAAWIWYPEAREAVMPQGHELSESPAERSPTYSPPQEDLVNQKTSLSLREEETVVKFSNSFEVKQQTEIIFHISADNRYELSLDGDIISRGPDRSDLLHWSFASYSVTIDPGKHTFSALVWHLGSLAPCAQISWKGAFIFAVDGDYSQILDTGTGFWQVEKLQGFEFSESRFQAYHVIGAAMTMNGRELFQEREKVSAVVVQEPLSSNGTGIVASGWQLYPSSLPEQTLKELNPGIIRAVKDTVDDSSFSDSDCRRAQTRQFQELISDNIWV